jgi:hypothetical protein
MDTFSYIATPVKGNKDQLIHDLSKLKFCEVIPAENRNLVILVTTTPNKDSEQHLKSELKQIKSLESLSMTYGHTGEA